MTYVVYVVKTCCEFDLLPSTGIICQCVNYCGAVCKMETNFCLPAIRINLGRRLNPHCTIESIVTEIIIHCFSFLLFA